MSGLKERARRFWVSTLFLLLGPSTLFLIALALFWQKTPVASRILNERLSSQTQVGLQFGSYSRVRPNVELLARVSVLSKKTNRASFFCPEVYRVRQADSSIFASFARSFDERARRVENESEEDVGAEFDENGFSTGTYAPKPSYYALQNLAALFSGDVVPTGLPVMQMPSHSPRLFHPDLGGCSLISGGFSRPDGTKAYAYWYPADLMTTDFESTITFEVAVKNLDTAKIRLIDPMDGSVYTIPETILKTDANGNVLRFEHLPVKDYPLFLTFGDFAGVADE